MAWPTVFSFTLTEQDLVDASRLASRPYMKVVAVLGIVVIAGGVVLLALAADKLMGAAFVLAGLIAVALSRVHYVSRWAVRWQVGALIGTEVEVRFSDEGVDYAQTSMSGQFDWSAITQIREDERMLFLLQGRIPRFGLPKRVFASPNDELDFRQQVIARIRR